MFLFRQLSNKRFIVEDCIMLVLLALLWCILLTSTLGIKLRNDPMRNAQNLEYSVIRKGKEYAFTSTSFPLILINTGGYCASFEVYACQKETQSLVISQIANWIQTEKYSTNYLINSLLFASLGTGIL